MAISNNRIPVARLLIERRADIHAQDRYGRTPLFAAVEMRNVDLHYTTFEHMVTKEDRAAILDFIELLLEQGAKPDVRVTEGRSERRTADWSRASLPPVNRSGVMRPSRLSHGADDAPGIESSA